MFVSLEILQSVSLHKFIWANLILRLMPIEDYNTHLAKLFIFTSKKLYPNRRNKIGRYGCNIA